LSLIWRTFIIPTCCELDDGKRAVILHIKVYAYVFLLFSEYLKVVKMPDSSQISDTFEGVEALVSGWGKTSESKHVEPLNS
jgi:hypothetical protein